MDATEYGRQTPDFPIVGIGASAGGIDALRSLFKLLPEQTGLAFVVVQHLSSEYPSQLPDLLEKSTALSVCEAEDGLKVEPDHVYIAAPGEALTLERGILRCRPFRAEEHAGIDSIDSFFESLAADHGRQAIAVVLSGTGKDGAAGIIRIRQAGGIVFVQNPHTAQHDGMPRAAIATGAANHILPLETMARELTARTSPAATPALGRDLLKNEDIAQPLDDIMALIRQQAGFDLSGYKLKPLLWQIRQRMKIRRVEQFGDYEDLLHDDPAELEALIRDIPIHVTEFFRDPEAWTVLAREVIAPLVQNHCEDRPLRIWTPACSSGEEAYSVAMLLAEEASQAEKPVDFQLFATDASFEIIARASRGIFSPAAVESISPERRTRFFYAADGAYRVKKSLREKLVFAPQHLLADPPFSDLDLVTCRNLLIYLEPSAQQRLLSLLHASLRMGGALFLGSGESLPPRQQGFTAVSMPWHIYRKTGDAADIRIRFPKRLERIQHSEPGKAALAERAHWAALEGFELPSVLIDDKFNILRVYGDTGAFLRLPPGEPTLNLLRVAQPALVTNLWIAADRAVAERRAVIVGGLGGGETGDFSLSLRITPMSGEAGRPIRLLVSFLRSAPTAGLALTESRSTGSSTAIPSSGPGTEAWSDALRLTIEELEASREELQALNEELKTVNDQLNIRNDEVNEINAELQAKIRELETQSHVLSSGAVMTLFLDEAMRIRWFTQALSELFPILPSDTGRKITELVPKFEDPYFIDEVQSVMRTAEPLESEVRNLAGRWYLRRIRPYRTEDQAIQGAAITFTDITELKQAEEALRHSERRLRNFYDAGLLGIVYWNMDGQIVDANDKFLAMVGYSREDLKAGRVNWRHMTPPEYRPLDERAMAELHATGFNAAPFEKEYVRKDGTRLPIILARALLDETRLNGVGFVLDNTDRKHAEAALHESEERLRFALEISRTGAWDLDLVEHTAHRSLEHDRIFGYDHLLPQWTYEMFLEHVLPEDRAEVEAKFREATVTASDWNFECRIRRNDGEIRWIWAAGRHYPDSRGNLRKMAGIVQDITDRKPATSQGSAE
jgi:two-component system CheB/CheR fusion protein